MIRVFNWIVVDHRIEPRSGQTKEYKFGIWCFFAKCMVLKSWIKDWLTQSLDYVSEWGDMSTCGLLFQ